MPTTKEPPLAADLLRGAGALAAELFGEDSERTRRRVYYLAELRRSKGERPPIFRIGSTLHARKSALLEWIRQRERETA